MFKFEVVQAPSGDWRVEHVRHDLEGQIEVTTFTGGRDEERARDYAAFMNRRTIG